MSGWALTCVREEFRGDKDVVLEAVKRNPWQLQYASEELQKDQEILEVIESQRKQEEQHTAQEIAQGIQPTKSAIKQVQDEMIAEQTRITEEQSNDIVQE